MAVSQNDINHAQNVGARGGHVNTSGMSSQDRNVIDTAVNKGKSGN